ncbi:F-box protein skp2a [Trifolium repens]|nr:F-box protein skp2a [Trifolium repens]
MYSSAQSKENNKMRGSGNGGNEDGLRTLNISQCTSLFPSAVQAVCDSSPALHTCSGRHSLVISGCLNLTSVHCACCFRPHSAIISPFPHLAH